MSVVDPTTLTIDVSSALAAFPMYAGFMGQPLRTAVTPMHRQWFGHHWREHRIA